jgi:hypothetical protein
MVAFGLDRLQDFTGWGFLDTIKVIFFFGLVAYLYFAMRNFYGQGWIKTLIKFLIVALLSLLMMLILFAIFLLFSAFTI